jgi:peptide/nickel transport system substrate-binding protein
MGRLLPDGPKACFDWPDDPELAAPHDQWIDTDDAAEQKRRADAIQNKVFSYAPSVPPGQYVPLAAWRKPVSGQLKGSVPVFRNVAKA